MASPARRRGTDNFTVLARKYVDLLHGSPRFGHERRILAQFPRVTLASSVICPDVRQFLLVSSSRRGAVSAFAQPPAQSTRNPHPVRVTWVVTPRPAWRSSGRCTPVVTPSTVIRREAHCEPAEA